MLISLAAAFVLPLFSCSDASNDVGSGMVSFYVDKALMQKAVELSDKVSKNPNDEPQDEGERKLRFEVALEGEYKATKTVYASFKEEPYTEDPTGDEPRQDGPRYNFDSFSIDFAGIPVGKTVWAKIKVYEESEQERDEPVNERREPLLYGKSQIISVSSGTNLLSVGAYSYRTYVPYKFTIQFDQEPDFSTCSYNRICAVDPASKFVAKLRAAKDDVDRYEACNQFEEKYSEDCWLGEMDLNYDAELSYSADGKTVTADGDMWMYVSEDDPASRAATALFVLICQNYSGKTKYYGMASSAMAPMKKQENMASFSAQKFDFIDTSYALYQTSSGRFDYYLSSSPSVLPSYSSVSASGTNYNITYSRPAFCFDAEGNLYAEDTVRVSEEQTHADIKSNNYSFASGGTFSCPNDPSGSPLHLNDIACDMKKNILYGMASIEANSYLVPLCRVPDGAGYGTGAQKYYQLDTSELIELENPMVQSEFAVDSGVGYFALSAGVDTDINYYLAKVEIPDVSLGEQVETLSLELVACLTDSISTSPGNSNGTIGDLIFMDGAAYVIYKEKKAGWDTMYAEDKIGLHSRGAVIKYDFTNRTVKVLGWNSKETKNVDYYKNSSLYLMIKNNNAKGPDIYKDAAASGLYLVDGSKYPTSEQSGDLLYNYFPYIRGSFNDNSTASAFVCPSKFIAIKPKKLVVSDDGFIFYTDNGGLSYKNSARVVTIDLGKFAKESMEIKESGSKFEGVSGYLTLEANLYDTFSSNAFYDAANIYYRATSGFVEAVGTNPSMNQSLYLAIKNGDEE